MRVTNPPAALAQFPTVVRLPVQWGDQDSFGHVNNAVYFRWFETARIAYLERVGLNEKHSGQPADAASDVGPILAAIGCNYRRQVKYPDTVLIGARITRIGTSSMTMAHALWSEAHQAIAADGESTIVVFNYEKNQPQRVPDSIRTLVAKLEGQDFS